MSNEEIDLRLKDPNHETTDSSYVTTLMEHMEYLKEEIKTKNYIFSHFLINVTIPITIITMVVIIKIIEIIIIIRIIVIIIIMIITYNNCSLSYKNSNNNK